LLFWVPRQFPLCSRHTDWGHCVVELL